MIVLINQPLPDINGRQRRLELSESAMRKLIESADKIGEIAAEQHHHTEQIEKHNEQFASLNDNLKEESLNRSKSDHYNRWFSVFVAVLSCLITYSLDHQAEIIEFVKQYLSWP